LKSASQVVAQALDLLRHKLTELEKADTAPLRDIRGALEPFTERVAEYAVAEVSSLLCQAVLVGCGKHHNVRIECVLRQPRAERSTGMAPAAVASTQLPETKRGICVSTVSIVCGRAR
jgi:hypothetical protein